MAEGFGRWESDPLFSAAEVVQDSADRMDSIYRLLLHDQSLVQGDTPDAKLLTLIQLHRRDLMTAMETTKWQLEEFEGAVRFASSPDKSNSRANAIFRHNQFIKAIKEQIVQVGRSLENMPAREFNRNLQFMSLDEPEIYGLELFLSGSESTDQYLQHNSQSNIMRGFCDSTSQCDEIMELDPHSEGLHGQSGPYDMEAGDSKTRNFTATRGSRGPVLRFLSSFWFANINKLTRSFTKRRKDGEATNGFILVNNDLPSLNFGVTSAGQVYTWAMKRSQKSLHLFSFCRSPIWILVASALLGIVVVKDISVMPVVLLKTNNYLVDALEDFMF